MAVNYMLDALRIRVDIVPGDLVTVKVRFMLAVPGGGLVDEIGDAVHGAIVGIGGKSLEMTQVRGGFPRCFYCGKENPVAAESCMFCGKSV